ncbi:MAG: hypothetical protein AAF492_26300, partial [Verrucomicrobiota bacterium]
DVLGLTIPAREGVTLRGEQLLLFPTLERIAFHPDNLTADAYAALARLPRLAHVSLRGSGGGDPSPIPDALKEVLPLCRAIQTVQLERARVGDEVLAVLAQLPNLQDVSLNAVSTLTEQGLAVLGALPNLKALSFGHETGFERFPFSPEQTRLESLSFEDTRFSDDTFAALPVQPNLKYINLEDSEELGPEGWKALGRQTSVETLNACGTEIDGEGLAGLAGMTGLKSLSLMSNFGLTDNDLAEMPGFESLTHLNLARCRGITDDGVIELVGRLPNLKEVDVSRSGCTAELKNRLPKVVSLIAR